MSKQDAVEACREIIAEAFPSELEAFEQLGVHYFEDFGNPAKDDQVSATRRHAAGSDILGAVVHFPAIIGAVSALLVALQKIRQSRTKESNQQISQTTALFADLLIKGGVDASDALRHAERTTKRLLKVDP